MDLLSPSAVPFSAALLLMVLLVSAEIVGVLIGIMPSAAIDSALPDFNADIDVDIEAAAGGPLDADAPQLGDTPGGLSRFLGWLSVGKVPVLVLMMAFLSAFGVIGLIVQAAATSTLGFPLPMLFSVPVAFVAALYPTRWLGRGIAAIFPKEHTEAASLKTFIGRTAVITMGTAQRGLSAEAKLTDQYGQSHYVRVEPDNDDETFKQGSDVLLVSKVGATYRVIQPTSEYLG
ncbi:MAG: YqiJ family protein [Pseudomonadota bacterium]